MKVKSLLLIVAVMLASTAQAQTFKGYDCRQDCSGHRAGYDWAARKGITDPSQCTGKSQSFVEGCMAYAQGR